MGTEVHHLEHQKVANEDGFIHTVDGSFHKNHAGNLVAVCEKCHHNFHNKKVDTVKKKVKTTKGLRLSL